MGNTGAQAEGVNPLRRRTEMRKEQQVQVLQSVIPGLAAVSNQFFAAAAAEPYDVVWTHVQYRSPAGVAIRDGDDSGCVPVTTPPPCVAQTVPCGEMGPHPRRGFSNKPPVGASACEPPGKSYADSPLTCHLITVKFCAWESANCAKVAVVFFEEKKVPQYF